jgi:DNA-binding CsgD family transcriptional regulator
LQEYQGIDPFSELVLTGVQFISLPSLGRINEALLDLPKFIHAAAKVNDQYTCIFAYYHIARLQATTGEWREARNYFETGASYYPYLPELLAWRASIEYMLGNIDRGDMYRRRLLRIYRRVPEGPFKHPIYVSYTAAVRALCSGEAGDIAKWVPIIQSIVADTSAHPFISIRAHLCLLLSGIILQNTRLIKNAVTVLEKPSRYYLIRPYKIRWALGLGKRQLRRTEEAISHFRDALSSARWYGDKPLEACILYDLGRSLFLEHDDTESRNMTIDLLQEARKLSCNIGMASLTERIDEITREIGITESLSIGTLRPLTKRERGVAACLEQGLSNKEIAENLSISVHTVINHIRHICEKTGTSSRGAAVAAIKRAESIRNTFP